MRAEPPTVFVTANIVRETAERPFSRLAVVVVGNTKAKAKPAEVDVRLVCPPEIVRQLRTEQVVPQAEVTSKEASGSVSAPVVVAGRRVRGPRHAVVGGAEVVIRPARTAASD
jgi:hypothetical protein